MVYIQVYVYSLLLHFDKFAPYNHILDLLDIESRYVINLSFSQYHPGDIDFNFYFNFNLDREL